MNKVQGNSRRRRGELNLTMNQENGGMKMETGQMNERLDRIGNFPEGFQGGIFLPMKERFEIEVKPGKERITKVRKQREPVPQENDVPGFARKPLKALKKAGLDAVPFCVHEEGEKEKSFKVTGEFFTWDVRRLSDYDSKQLMDIPRKGWEVLQALQNSGLRHDGVYLATPLTGAAMKKTMDEFNACSRNVVACLVLIAAIPLTTPLLMIGDNIDPVLAVRFIAPGAKCGVFYELHRWI